MKYSAGQTDLLVRVLHVGEMGSCCYLVGTKDGDGMIVDAGDEAGRIVQSVKETRVIPQFIVLTHGHADHIGALDEVRVAFPDAQCCIHAADAAMLERPSLNLSLFLGRGFKRKLADRLLRGGEVLELNVDASAEQAGRTQGSPLRGGEGAEGGRTQGSPLQMNAIHVHVIHVPGHTPGGICLHIPEAKVVFTGDVLFAGGIGRTDFPGGNADLLLKGVREKLLVLPPETVVYPGHGPGSTIGEERDGNPFLRE